MQNDNYQNEHLKILFGEYLSSKRNKYTENSIVTYLRAVSEWQTFSDNEDFSSFSTSKAIAFRKWLKKRKSKNGGKLSLRTQDNYLRRIKKFFDWLVNEPNQKIPRNAIEQLTLSSTEQKSARNKPKKIPTLKEAEKLFDGIDDSTLIGQRDKALISLAIITGARVGALTSLSIKSFHLEKLTLYQYPDEGVNTKNAKYIMTTFLPIKWTKPQEYFINWYKQLIKLGYQDEHPLFPANLKSKIDNRLQYSQTELSFNFLNGSSSFSSILKIRCKEAGIPYYTPHSFRDLFVTMIMKRTLSPFQLKALSMTLGHEHIHTTLESYGNLQAMKPEGAVDIVKKMLKEENDTKISNVPDEELGRLIKESITNRNSKT